MTVNIRAGGTGRPCRGIVVLLLLSVSEPVIVTGDFDGGQSNPTLPGLLVAGHLPPGRAA